MERKTGFYILKVIIPLILVVLMSWVVFWMTPDSGDTQIQIAITSMLTVIAFQFAIGQSLPVVSYMTRMDQFILFSTILVFLAILKSLYTKRCFSHKQEQQALKLDRICRLVFPLSFVLIGLYLLVF